MPAPRDLWTLIGLALAGLVVRGAFAVTWPWPWDWDAAYYRVVARNIAEGRGAVVDGAWSLVAIPGSGTAPADLYWQPLPSRVLVPEVALLGTEGHLTIALLAAALGPLAWALARSAGLARAPALVAGILALTGGAWMRLLATTDVYALTAVLGGIGLLGIVRERWVWTAVAALLLAWTRNDGFLVGLCLAVGFSGWRAVAVGVAGPVATAVWTLRNVLVGGPLFWAGRQAATGAGDYAEIFIGRAVPLTLAERVGTSVEALSGIALAWGWLSMLLGLPLLLLGAWQARRQRWAWAWLAGVGVLPFVVAALAPATVHGGTLQRTGIAWLVAHAVLLAWGIERVADWGRRVRDLAPAFTRTVLAGGGVGLALWVGLALGQHAEPPPDCASWEAVPEGRWALLADPLVHDAVCGRSGLLVLDRFDADRIDALAAEHGACHALIDPEDRDEERPEGLAGWEEIAPGVLRHPAWDGAGCATTAGASG